LNDIAFVNEDLGWAVGKGAAILKTSDGGVTWEYQRRGKVSAASNEWFYDVVFVDSLHGWCVGGKGAYPANQGIVLHTSDGGRSWSEQPFELTATTDWLFGVTFLDSTLGWVVGGEWGGVGVGGKIFKTVDGGNNWTELDIPTSKRLEGIAFADSLHGWAVGTDGVILHTSDGGDSWTLYEVDTLLDPQMRDVAAPDTLHAWAVGVRGTIYHTGDGGETWNAQDSPTDVTLSAVTFVNSTTGWAVGADGIIVQTTNGDATWNTQPSGINITLNGATFLDALNVFVVGSEGLILTTTTGGL
jgi:photosystem II stability/assembly factor-like uncharacterized protein